MLEHVPGIVYTLSNKAVAAVTTLSGRAEDVFGYPLSRWLDDPAFWLSIVHPDERDAVGTAWRAAVGAGQPFDLRYRIRRADGRWLWVHDRTTPVLAEDGSVDHWQGIAFDVTAEQEAHLAVAASETRYRTLLEQLPVVVYAVSDEREPATLYCSPTATEVLGYPASAMVDGKLPFPDFVHEPDRAGAWAAWERAFSQRTRFDAEYRLPRGDDGALIWIRDTCALVRLADGSPAHWQGVMMDVTAEKQARIELATSEEQHRALVEHVPVVVYEMGPGDERRALYVSSRIEAMLGYTRHEWLDQPDIWTELLHPDDREQELAAHDLHSETGQPWSREYRLIAADGSVVWVRDQATLVAPGAGAPSVWHGILLDITAQKQVEERLRLIHDELELRVLARTAELAEANELMGLEVGERRRAERELRSAQERFRHLVEQVPAVAYTWHANAAPGGADFTYVGPQIESLLGYTPEEWFADERLWKERLHPHDADRIAAATLHCERTGEPFEEEYRYLTKDGRIVWVLDRAALLSRTESGEPLLFQGLMIDITDAKTTAAEADEAAERIRRFAEEGPVITYAYELIGLDPPEMRIEHVGPQLASVLGYPAADWIERPARWFEMMHPDDRERMQEEALAVWTSGSPWDTRYRMLTADGRVIWLNDRGRCVGHDDEGRPRLFAGVVIEQTEQIEEEIQLRAEVAGLRGLMEHLPAITWIQAVDPASGRSRYRYMSPGVLEITGYTAAELQQEPDHLDRVVHEDDREQVARLDREADRTGTWNCAYRIRHRDGSIRRVLSIGTRLPPNDEGLHLWYGVTIDVTDRGDRTVVLPAEEAAPRS